MKNNKIFILNAIIIYILILIPSLNVPFQSDDYSYFLKGISWDQTISHYMGWSGRLITDFTSSFLLKYLSYTAYETINAFVFLCLCMFISIIPTCISNSEYQNKNLSTIVLWIIFLAYWISNPNLGQTSFWIVGSANYLWTIMWASAYIAFILYLTNIKSVLSKKDYIFLGIIGLLAGCSNENTSVSIVLFTGVLFFIEQRKKLLTVGLITSLLGALILIMAPGNGVRKKWFQDWYSKSTFEQLNIHIFERMPNVISQYLHAYLLIIAALIILILLQKKINNKSILYAGIFFILSIFSNLVLVKAPYIGGRNLNTGLFFLLPMLAIIIYEFQNLKGKLVKVSNFVIIIYALLFFIPSYIYFTFMMMQTKAQHEIREKIINNSKNNNEKTAFIPEWYFTKLLKESDRFDTFKSGSMEQFYNIENIVYTPINFNYAGLKTGDKYIINHDLKENLKLLNIYNYTTNILSFNPKKGLVFEFNESIKNYIEEGDNALFIHIYDENGQFLNADRSILDEVEINGKFYIDTSLGKINMSKVVKIVFGFYNATTGKNSAVFEIKLDRNM